MTQSQRRSFLIRALLEEQGRRYGGVEVPRDQEGQRRLLRSLFNLRPPLPASPEFLEVQDAYLREETARRGITRLEDLEPAAEGLYLWQGDITTLACGAIVNAANSQLLGCFVPCHGCIDNAIHTYAGVQLRLECARLMERQGRPEPPGQAKLTPAFNLPCRYVLHTVGPIVSGKVTGEDRRLLASCYRSCLELAEAQAIPSLAFCCISTGEFHFPRREAAQIALDTVRAWRRETGSKMEVIFNVFRDDDLSIYRRLLASA